MKQISRIIRKDARSRHALSRFDALQDMCDEDLMEHFQAGVVEAYNILWERWTGPLVNFLYRFTGDKKACEDLIQETFLRVYRNRHSYKRIAKFSTWLYTIAGNLAKTEYRKRSRRRMDSIQSYNRDGEEFEMPLPDETFSPIRHAESAMQDHFIQMGLLALPEHFREIVIMRDIQQLSYEEIAIITGLPMGTVKSRINRGRTKLQDLLQGIYPYKYEDEDDIEEDEALAEYA
ncbi:MAG: sigma-70 family RNA polymerase sigma factor [Bacteroidetes bacterium]|nr:sigma-70 family RNA polymerase sigma factor [Bacteroidota bacterium]MCY4233055.1 sigma-70 family RNA polymerase sigma factor [Bacteroidota bacterium]